MTLSVLVFGGTGVFGRYIVEDLLKSNHGFKVTVCARRAEKFNAAFPEASSNLHFAVGDIADAGVRRELIGRHDVVILAVGPFQGIALDLVTDVMAAGKHYIDICDDPDYVMRLRELKEKFSGAKGMALSGLSSLPGLSLPLAREAAAQLENIEDIHIGLFIGNKNRKGRGAVFSSLENLNGDVTVYEKARPVTVSGWSRLKAYDFPAGIGKVTSGLFASPDPLLFAGKFKFTNLDVWVGFEWFAARWAFRLFKKIAELGGVRLVKKTVDLFFPLFELAHAFGTERGAVSVIMTGTADVRPATVRAGIFAARQGQRMASVPAVIACEALAEGKITGRGVLELDEWMPPAEFLSRMQMHGFALSMEKW